ncbi:copia protein [Tanacetum coccineum]
MKVKESLNVTFDETPPPPKTSPSEDDYLIKEEVIDVNKTRPLGNNLEDKPLENNEIINIKESKSHLLDNVIDFKLFQMDVKNAFLNDFINEEVYVAQPPGFIDFAKPNQVYRLKKGLYRLKQALKAWYNRLKAFLIKHDYTMGMCLLYARLQEDQKTSHLEAATRIFRYIKGTTHLGLWYPKGSGIKTIVYVDSDHARDYVDRKSTSGIYTFMGCFLTSWLSKKQTALAISTTEAEYVSATKACQQALWMKQALIDYDVRLDDVPIMCGNKDAIDLSKNPVKDSRTKHIEIRHHFLRDNVQKGHISIEKVPSVDNIADILTKPLKRESFNYLRLGLGMETIARKTAKDHQHTKDYIPIRLGLYQVNASHIDFDCLLEINEQICPHFILEFYSQYRLEFSDEGQMLIQFVIQNNFFSYTLEEFSQILSIPHTSACVFTDKWSLDDLQHSVPSRGPYQADPPCPDEIKNYDHVPACLRYMLYCVSKSERFNLAFFIAERMEFVTKQAKLILPYGRHSTSSSSAFDHPSSSHLNDDGDDENDDGTSRASTPSLLSLSTH